MNSSLARIGSAILLLCAVLPASAQVAVYRMDFEQEPHSINFSFFEGGYLVLDGLSLTGSFLFTYPEDNRDLYLTADNAAQMFVAIKGDQRRAVVRATAQTQTSLSHYLAIGDLDETISFLQRGQRVSFEVASDLNGHVLASDDESDLSGPVADGTLGFAGLAAIRLSLDRELTSRLNAAGLTLSEAVDALAEELERQGYRSGAAADEDDGDTGEDATSQP